ncbi:hypothetical protein GTP23_12810 [Pseudoduganella sp. FT93W]|uniref:Uncharacterized protein n=1 Tax=Duganella fentianensis TaxID=2692177 RepID=A0A845HY57_9BURK|nr:hypothetical protein [Duganella fentianensis]MYN45929.1 hypothetical protein [Duganella fentianensis]
MTKKTKHNISKQSFYGAEAVLIIFAAEASGNIKTGATEEQKQMSKTAVEEFLHAAYVGGYTQGEILETLLWRGNPDERLGAMVKDACDAVGVPALREIFGRAGLPRR